MSATAELEARSRALVRELASEYPFESHFLELEQARLHFVDEGPREKNALLFLHGNPTWSFLWRHLIRDLRGENRCVAPDHVGCGLSDKPQDYEYRLARHIDNVERLVDALGLERVTLVLHDWGGAIGCGLAVRRPELVERLIVLNTAAFRGPCPLRIRVCRTPLFGALAVRGFNAFARAALVMAHEQELSPLARRGMIAPYGNWHDRIATLRFVEDIPLSAAHATTPEIERIERGLAQLESKPVCVIWGEKDWCFTPHFRAEWQRRFPRARVHVAPDAGHWVTEDAREDVARWVRAFLDETSQPS